MNFDDIKDNLLERMRQIATAVRESDSFILLRERFEGLPPNYQKLITTVAGLLIFYFIYSIPASYMSASEELETSFDENRQLTRELISASREGSSVVLPPDPPSGPGLIAAVDGVLKNQRVMDGQKRPTQNKDDVIDKKLVPGKIKSEGVVAKVQQLNLSQVVYIGEDLNNKPGLKLINMHIQADAKDPHYFNVDYEVAAFSVGNQGPSDGEEPTAGKKKSNKKSKR